MKSLKIVVTLILLCVSVVYGKITATIGGLNKPNQLIYISQDKLSKILFIANGQSIAIKTQNGISCLNNQYIKNPQPALASLELLQQLYKQQSQSIVDTLTIQDSQYSKDELKDILKDALIQKYNQNYISHKVLGITMPDEIDTFASIQYEVKIKAPYQQTYIYSYPQLINTLLISGVQNINQDRFILSINNNYYKAKIDIQNTFVKTNISNQTQPATKYTVILQGAKQLPKEIFKLYIDTNSLLPYKFSLITLQGNMKSFVLDQIINNGVAKYDQFVKTHKLQLDGFDFSIEPIRAKYKVQTKNGVRYLSSSFKMVGKRKNVIAVELLGSQYIFDPKKGSDMLLQHKGYLLDAKRFLFEVKKILKVDNQTKIQWKQSPKSTMVQIKYIDKDGKLASQKVSKGAKQYYDISALWYLVSWNKAHNIGEKKFLLMNEEIPFEAVYIPTDYGYLINYRTKDKYKFYLDKYNRVTKVEDIQNNITISLTKDGFVNDTIEQNKQKLKKLMQQYNLKEVQ